MKHRLLSALAFGTTLAFTGIALANPPSPAPSTNHPSKKSKDKHHSDGHQQPAPKK